MGANVWPIRVTKVPLTHLPLHQVHPALHRPKAIHPLVNQQSAVVLGTLGRAPILITHSVMPTRRIARVHAARSGSPEATYRIPAFHSGRKDVQLIQIVACGVTVTRKAFVIMMSLCQAFLAKAKTVQFACGD